MKNCIVVGAGILGASTAYHLAKSGVQVTIVDRNVEGQATDAAAGIVCPWLSQRRNQRWYRLARSGAKFYPELMADLDAEGEVETGYARVGAISIHTDENKVKAMAERALRRRDEAPEMGEIRILTPGEAKTIFPPLAEEYHAVYVSGAARVDGRALRDTLLRAAKRHGAEFVTGKAELCLENKQVIGVKTASDQFLAEKVVVTNGAWAQELFEPLSRSCQIDFQKGQIIHMHIPETETNSWPVVMPPGNTYIVPFSDGKVVAGTTHEKDTGFDLRVTVGGMNEILQRIIEVAPGLKYSTWTETRVGFRPFTPDFLPIIGPIPGISGAFIANGLGSSGLTVGPYLGRELARLVLDEALDISLEDYHVAHVFE